MKQIIFWTVTLVLSVGLWACSSDNPLLNPLAEAGQPAELPQEQSQKPPELPPEPEVEAWVYGRLMDANRHQPVDVPVHISAGEHTASMQGGFFFIKLPVGREHLLVIEAPVDRYPRTSHRVMAQAGVSTYVELWMLPFGASETFDVSAGGLVTTSGAEVVFQPNSLNATGEVTARLAWLNAADEKQLSAFPGGFRTDEGKLLESFGAIVVEVRDAAGNLVNLNKGAHAAATIPVSNVPADTEIPLWVYDEDAGLWKKEGEPLTDCSSGFCLAELPHLSWWNADIVIQTTCLTVCVADTNGHPAAGVYIEARGVDYFNFTTGFSGADGCACLPVRVDSHVNVTATTLSGDMGSVNVGPTTLGPLACGSPACTEVSLTVAPPKFQAILSWEGFEDLDAHLTGPCPDCVGGQFHVFHGDRGSLSHPFFAALNNDACAFFNEQASEIISLSACAEGSYRYSVFNNVGMSSPHTPQATLTLLFPDGSLLSYSAGASFNALPLWTVGELQCNVSCECTWQPINTFEVSDVFLKAGQCTDKPPVFQ